MKKSIFLALTLVGFITASAQGVGIGTNTPDTSSYLDLTAVGTTKGLILSKLTNAQRDALQSPPAGLVIYNDELNTLEVVVAGSPNAWKRADTNATTNVNTAAAPAGKGKVGIGTTSPNVHAILEVQPPTNKGVLLPRLAADPTGVEGMIYYNTTDNAVKLYNGTAWVKLTN